MIPSGSTNDNDNGGNNDHNKSNNDSVPRTVANWRSQLFRPYSSGHAPRRSNARTFFFTCYIFGAFEVLFLIKYLFVPIGLFW